MTDLAVAARSILLDPAAALDHDLHQRLLAQAPVLRTPGGSWLVSGHEQVRRLASDPRLTIDPRAGDPPLPLTQSARLEELFANMLNFRDGEPHARLRRLAAAAFSARQMARTAASVERVVAELIDDALAAGTFDAVADLGVPLPVRSSCALLELPPDSWPAVSGWAQRMAEQLFRFGQSPDELAEVEGQLAALRSHIDRLAEERRGGDDLIAQLLRASEAPAGDALLTREEFVAFVVLLFMNGLETVTAAVSTCVAALLWRPGLADLLRERPELAGDVFDELVRLDSPARMGARRALAPIEVGDGQTIATGEPVFLLWAVANRDPRVFADPDEFRPGRSGRHLGFGAGPHHCLGAALAQLQGVAVLRQLPARAALSSPVTPADAPRRRSVALSGYRTLPVRTISYGAPAVPASRLTRVEAGR